MPVTILDAWVSDNDFPTNGLSLAPSAGSNRVGIVCVSHEMNGGGGMSMGTVTWGDQTVTELHDDIAGSASGYHNLNYVGYLTESQIAAMSGNALAMTITNGNGGVGPFDNAKAYMGVYRDVDQADIVSDSNAAQNSSTSSLAPGVIDVDVDQKVVAFIVNGQPNACSGGTGYTTEEAQTGGSNGHASAVAHRTATTNDDTHNIAHTAAGSSRMAVSNIALGFDAGGPITASGAASVGAIEAAGVAHLAPKVWLNSTQSKSGATEMTITAHSATSITFDDPVGAPTGALYLGVENRGNSDIAWIAVTVSEAGETASGAGIIPAIEAAGVAQVHRGASGAASIGPVEAAGVAKVRHVATGAASITAVEGAGVAKVHRAASGAASIAAIEASGSAQVHRAASGAASIPPIEAAGVASVSGFNTASGGGEIGPIEGSGVAKVHRHASGSPTMPAIEASGIATVHRAASGAAILPAIEASGVASIKVKIDASGAAVLPAIEAAGVATLVRVASGSAELPSIEATGVATIVHTASGAATIGSIQAAGVAVVDVGPIVAFENLIAREIAVTLEARYYSPVELVARYYSPISIDAKVYTPIELEGKATARNLEAKK